MQHRHSRGGGGPKHLGQHSNRSNRKQRFGFSSWLYRQRNLVERFFNRIKQFRGIATRYDKDAANYLAAIKLICACLWCNA
jgi:transposase